MSYIVGGPHTLTLEPNGLMSYTGIIPFDGTLLAADWRVILDSAGLVEIGMDTPAPVPVPVVPITPAAIATLPGITPIVQIGLGDTRIDVGQAQFNVSYFNDPSSTFSAVATIWIDVECDVHDIQMDLGRERATDRFEPGTAILVIDNSSGWADLDPDNIATLTLRPGRRLRVIIDHETLGAKVLWHGYIDAVTPTYDPGLNDTVIVECIDALGEAGRGGLATLAAPVAEGELGSNRIKRILDAISWPVLQRQISSTSTPMIATSLGGQALDKLTQVADSEGGAVFGDLDGRVAYRGKDWQSYPSTQPNDGTIGNVVGEVCPSAWEISHRRSEVVTQIVLGRDDGNATPQRTYNDSIGQAMYGIESPYTLTDLVAQSDTQLDRLADRLWRTRGKYTAPRIVSVTIDAATSIEARDLLTNLSVFEPSRYRCRHVLPRGTVFDRTYFATGVSHHLSPEGWAARIALDLASPWIADGGRFNQADFDNATFGV